MQGLRSRLKGLGSCLEGSQDRPMRQCLRLWTEICEIPFQLGLSKMDLRKMIKSSLSGVDKLINAMYRKLQKNLTSEELLPSLWDKCKKEFLDKYESFVQLVGRIYPNEAILSVGEMRDLLANM